MLSEQQQRIMGYFIEEAKDHLNTIEQGLLNLQNTIGDAELASEVFRAAHSVKGGAAMLGLNSIQQTAHRLEDYFKVLKECPLQVDQKLESLLLRVFDGLQELLEQLQGPFGLTDDKAQEVMTGVEPVFTALNEHLNYLVRQAGATTPEDVQLGDRPQVAAVGAVPATVFAKPQSVIQEKSALQLIFGSDVPARLRDMLQLFKQVDTDESRQQLQDICQNLIHAGEQFDLPTWVTLLQTAQQAIACPDNTYRTLAPIVIKEIKQAQEQVLSGQVAAILASDRLQSLVPALVLQDSWDDGFADLLTTANLEDGNAVEVLDIPLESFEEFPPFDADEEDVADDQWFTAAFTASQDPEPELGTFDRVSDPLFSEDMGLDAFEPTTPEQASFHEGPEVGIAELNSLADLFEGEVSDLGLTWQEEDVVGDGMEDLPDFAPADSASDFSDLFFDQDGLDDLALEPSMDDEDLSGLLNSAEHMTRQNEITIPAEDSFFFDQAPPSTAADEAFLFGEPEINEADQETADLSALFADTSEETPLESLATEEWTIADSMAASDAEALFDSASDDFESLFENAEISGDRSDIQANQGLQAQNSYELLEDSTDESLLLDALNQPLVEAPSHTLPDALLAEEPLSAVIPFWSESDVTSDLWVDSEELSSPFNLEDAVSLDAWSALDDIPLVGDTDDANGVNVDGAEDALVGLAFDDVRANGDGESEPEEFALDWAQTDDEPPLLGLFDGDSADAGSFDADVLMSLDDSEAESSHLNQDEANWFGAEDLDLLEVFSTEPQATTSSENTELEQLFDAASDENDLPDLFDQIEQFQPESVAAPSSFETVEEMTGLEGMFDQLDALSDTATDESEETDLLLGLDALASDTELSAAFASLDVDLDLATLEGVDPAIASEDEDDAEFSFTEFSFDADDEPDLLVDQPVEPEMLDTIMASSEPATIDAFAELDFADRDQLMDQGDFASEHDLNHPLDSGDLGSGDAEWDAFMQDVTVAADTSITEASGLDDFSDLDALLERESVLDFPEASTSSDSDSFADLDALLEDAQVDAVALQPEVAPLTSTPSSDGGDAFDDLERLLEDAEQSLGGSPSARRTGSPALSANRRTTRPGRNSLGDQTMRVPVKHLDNLNNLVGELVVNRNSLEQAEERLRQFLDNLLYQVQQLSDVGQRMRDLYERSLLESSLLSSRRSYQLASQTNSGFAPASNHATGVSFDALEMDRFTGFHTLSQEMIELIVRVRESASDIDFVVDETDQITRNFRQITTQLQEGLTRSRMVPFSQTADRLPRAVRDISLKCGKQAELVIEGRDTLIDKMILEQLYDPMTHLVNNAITHGIETPNERTGAGKTPTGRITIRTFHQGNQTVISVTDDGAGIDPERVKLKAIEKGLITRAEAQEMSRLDVYDLLFHHGFSTRDKADDFAGRGVGMDVVRTSLNEIRGVVNIDSAVGRGTTFTIRLPLTLSISKALCCISNRARIAFPMDGVEDMLDVPKERIQMDEQNRPCIQWRDTLLPFQTLSELLKYNRSLGRGSVYGGNQEEDIVSVVVLRSNAGNYLALQVDQVLGEQEIVIKQLEGPIPKPVGVAGATVLGDGRIMPIADVLELIDLSMGRIRREAGSSLWEKTEDVILEPHITKTEPTVLIVDDSITVRELLSMTFNKIGYRVEQARDGQEAWEKLRSGLPCDLVFCDIEMPRMDGLELLSRIQKDSNLNHMPIAMLTSRGADRHRQMAIQLGAKGYFTKPYLEEAILDAAQRMLKGEVLVANGG